jgi:hypothetical protein
MAHGRYNWSAKDASSSMAPDPTFAFIGGRYYPILDFVFAFWIVITFDKLLTSLFFITALPAALVESLRVSSMVMLNALWRKISVQRTLGGGGSISCS